jgi:hypothetical protein
MERDDRHVMSGHAEPNPEQGADRTGPGVLAEIPRVVDAVVLLVVGVLMLRLTWRGWADPLVDYGRELYVPWRLSEGQRLYTDIAWFNGPLAQHVNALWFRVFGAGAAVLGAANALVLAATAWLFHRLVEPLSDRLTAWVATAFFLVVFGFGQYVGISNYNWISPYSHEITHGVALALACLAALATWQRTGAPMWRALSGLAVGLCFLTKVEPFVAAAAASVAMLVFSGPRGRRGLAPWLAAAAAPVGVSAIVFGVRGTLGAWPSVLSGEVAELPFYRAGMGLDRPGLRLEETVMWAAIWFVALLVPVASAWLARETRSRLAAPIAGGVTVLFLLGVRTLIPWTEALRPLHRFVLLALGVLLAGLVRDSDAKAPPESVALGVLGLALLSKMLLNVRVGHYGFALAAPAAVFTVVALARWLPDAVDRRGMRGAVVRGAVLGLLAVFAFEHARVTHSWMERKTEQLGSGVDAMRTDLRGAFVQRAVDHVRAAGYRSIAVLPEGVMVNYLARTPNPTRYLNFMPPEEILFGDAAWEEAFRRAPPDAIVIVPKDTSEFGRGPFGIGYGTRLAAWIREEYAPAASLRIEGVNYAVQILVRRNSPT